MNMTWGMRSTFDLPMEFIRLCDSDGSISQDVLQGRHRTTRVYGATVSTERPLDPSAHRASTQPVIIKGK